MNRTTAFAAALSAAAAALTAVAVPAEAQTRAHYVAKPAAQATKASVITRSTPWSLANGVYVANRAPERALILCQLLARDVGALESFSAGGAPLPADELAKCNARAKGGAGVAVAATGAPAAGR